MLNTAIINANNSGIIPNRAVRIFHFRGISAFLTISTENNATITKT
jgi:hypothetical protein